MRRRDAASLPNDLANLYHVHAEFIPRVQNSRIVAQIYSFAKLIAVILLLPRGLRGSGT